MLWLTINGMSRRDDPERFRLSDADHLSKRSRPCERRDNLQLAWKVAEGSKVKLKNYDPDFIDKHTDRALAMAELEQLGKGLGELQELLAAAKRWGWAEAIEEDLTPLKTAGLPGERQERGIAVRDPWSNGIWLSAHAALPLTPLMSW
jgi:hypothetical protein